MIVKVIGSGEVVEQVFWLDLRSRTCGVKLRHPTTGYQRCSERPLADFLLPPRYAGTHIDVELVLGEQTEVILREED